MVDLTDNHLYKKESCPKCGTFITILHTHSSLVCALRKEIKELKDKYKIV